MCTCTQMKILNPLNLNAECVRVIKKGIMGQRKIDVCLLRESSAPDDNCSAQTKINPTSNPSPKVTKIIRQQMNCDLKPHPQQNVNKNMSHLSNTHHYAISGTLADPKRKEA